MHTCPSEWWCWISGAPPLFCCHGNQESIKGNSVINVLPYFLNFLKASLILCSVISQTSFLDLSNNLMKLNLLLLIRISAKTIKKNETRVVINQERPFKVILCLDGDADASLILVSLHHSWSADSSCSLQPVADYSLTTPRKSPAHVFIYCLQTL